MTETTYADQRGHDVTWMTAAERNVYDRRTPQYWAAIHAEAAYDSHAAGKPHDTTACGMPHS